MKYGNINTVNLGQLYLCNIKKEHVGEKKVNEIKKRKKNTQILIKNDIVNNLLSECSQYVFLPVRLLAFL